ncbi:NAD-dependent epimerase/dehydratase family protein [Paenibacillus sp. FSL R5-0744]|uniref:NAD-dependent epimerase/dehydratase family protein n=1 Tax=Paenibacillus sp. FSL R5-0744 TaxID=2921656 RepID=UPI0030DCD7DA
MSKRKILITGKGSYVGTSLMKWLQQWSDLYSVEFLSLRGEEWRSKDLTKYDVVFHVAALVHKKEKSSMEDQYFKVNRDLTMELAIKAKESGIGHFIFMSSFSVYGLNGEIGGKGVITNDTPCKPTSFYGKSKLEAEKKIQQIANKDFKVAIVRTPMVYGPNSPGNYERLRKVILKINVFPYINNQRSMIFIDYLSEFIRMVIDNQAEGLFFPQNRGYVNTLELMKLISKENNRNVFFSRILGAVFSTIGKHINAVNKVFGNLVFDLEDSNHFEHKYCFADLSESISICEKKACERIAGN